MEYFKSRIIAETALAELRPKVEEELKKEGFGILTEIDLQATMKVKLDKDYLPHIILGACNPVYADKVLSIEPTISTMLPCNVTLRELGNGNVEVAMVSPLAAMEAIGKEALTQAAKEIQEKLDRILINI